MANRRKFWHRPFHPNEYFRSHLQKSFFTLWVSLSVQLSIRPDTPHPPHPKKIILKRCFQRHPVSEKAQSLSLSHLPSQTTISFSLLPSLLRLDPPQRGTHLRKKGEEEGRNWSLEIQADLGGREREGGCKNQLRKPSEEEEEEEAVWIYTHALNGGRGEGRKKPERKKDGGKTQIHDFFLLNNLPIKPRMQFFFTCQWSKLTWGIRKIR